MNIKLSTAILSLVLSAAGLLSASADNNVSLHDNNSTNPQAIYYIDAPRFVRPLVEKWITEYQKVQPAAHFAVAKSAANRDASILHVQLSDNTAGNGQKTVYFAQYAILPVTTKGSDADKALSRNELNVKKLKQLFFSGDDSNGDNTDAGSKKATPFNSLVVYTGSGTQSVSRLFAAYYGQDASTFRGKRIIGDDQFLNTAIAKGPKGVTINAVSNLYDLSTRQLKSGLTLLSLDVDKSLQTILSGNASLDELLSSLETTTTKNIPIERIGLTSTDDNDAVDSFVDWVATNSQTYNHQYGLLNLNKSIAKR